MFVFSLPRSKYLSDTCVIPHESTERWMLLRNQARPSLALRALGGISHQHGTRRAAGTRYVERFLLLGQKSCRTKVSRIFRIFVPNVAPNFAPNFPRIFRGLFVLRFVGDGDQKNSQKNPRHFQYNIPRQTRKKKIHKILLESRQTNLLWSLKSLHIRSYYLRNVYRNFFTGLGGQGNSYCKFGFHGE